MLERCDLPLTARGVANRVFIHLAVFDIGEQGLALRELALHVSVAQVQPATGATLMIPSEPAAMCLSLDLRS